MLTTNTFESADVISLDRLDFRWDLSNYKHEGMISTNSTYSVNEYVRISHGVFSEFNRELEIVEQEDAM